jgi:hypothetical protein
MGFNSVFKGLSKAEEEPQLGRLGPKREDNTVSK